MKILLTTGCIFIPVIFTILFSTANNSSNGANGSGIDSYWPKQNFGTPFVKFQPVEGLFHEGSKTTFFYKK